MNSGLRTVVTALNASRPVRSHQVVSTKDFSMNKFICSKCNTEHATNRVLWQCPCGGLLDIDIKPCLSIDTIKQRKPTMWRYREMLPIDDDTNIVTFNEGFTPMVKMLYNQRSVWVKQDYLFPTGSYKDRGASVLISKAKELGINKVIEDSSGNAGAAIAAYCARAGIRCQIFVPHHVSDDKIGQIQAYAAEVRVIKGTREDVARATFLEAARTYYASHCWNPYFIHGTKTFAYEVCEQLDWYAPHAIVVPVGHGTLLIGAYIGFTELLSAGIINRLPKIIAIQAERCAPLAFAFSQGEQAVCEYMYLDTVAEGIAISNPVRKKQILTAVHMSNGHFITVTDAQIIDALKRLCSEGFYVEPTAATAIAGLIIYLQDAPPNEIIVTTLTGHGLKTSKILKDIL